MTSLGKKITSGLVWRFGERVLAQGVTFVVSLIVSRILGPSAYGMVALLLVFINLSEVFLTAGFGNSLIQKKNSDNVDFSSVFYFNVIFSIVLYLIVFFAAPFVEDFYGKDYVGLTSALRVLAIRIPITAINNVQQSYVSKNMVFKKFFFATIGGSFSSAVVGITMALNGFGVWALVAQYLFNALVNTLVLWFTVKWRPILAFSFERLKGLISYGWKLLCANLFFSLSNNIRSILIGKFYTSSDLAYYNRGKQIPDLIADTLNTSILSVMFPALCKIQNDKEQMKALVRRAVKTLSYFLAPILFGIALLSEKLVVLVLSNEWIGAVPFIKIFCISCMLQPVMKPCQQVTKALGKSGIFLILEIIKCTITILLLLITLKFGVIYIAFGYIASSIIGMFIDIYVGGRMIKYNFFEQFFDVIKPVLVSLVMYVLLSFIDYIPVAPIVRILLQVVMGVIFYWFVSLATKDETYIYVVNRFLRRKAKK